MFLAAGSRRDTFIKAFDELLDTEEELTATSKSAAPVSEAQAGGGSSGGSGSPRRKTGDPRFDAIVKATGELMAMNNELMLEVKQSPWWEKYLAASCCVAVAGAAWGTAAIYKQLSAAR